YAYLVDIRVRILIAAKCHKAVVVPDAIARPVLVETSIMTNITCRTRVMEGCTPDSISADAIASPFPVVFRGLVKDWKLVHLANESSLKAVKYLKSHYNGRMSLINRGHPGINGRYFYENEL